MVILLTAGHVHVYGGLFKRKHSMSVAGICGSHSIVIVGCPVIDCVSGKELSVWGKGLYVCMYVCVYVCLMYEDQYSLTVSSQEILFSFLLLRMTMPGGVCM